tara:strand:+ start:247 stop:1473 length:1227 start_codon:yes stop_codon:yes gene_type:complete
MKKKILDYYFLILLSFIPIAILIGPSISLINIILIDISFIILIAFKKEFFFLKDNSIKFLFLLYAYLIFNSFVSIDIHSGLARNLGFIHMIILFSALNYFLNIKFFKNKILLIWLITLVVVSFDVIFEFYYGKNTLGFNSIHSRIVSFFGDEAIVGGYLAGFFLIIIGFLHENYNDKYKSIILLFSLFFVIVILLTGERSNGIKALLGIIIFYFFFREYNFKTKLLITTLCLTSFLIILFNVQYLNSRYIKQISHIFSGEQKTYSSNQVYFSLYKSGFNVFKDNMFFGVGNKNYRVATCLQNENEINKKSKYVCNTHPHQIYFEFLSEHGIFGTILLLFIFYKLILSKIKNNIMKLNYTQLGSFIFLVLTFLPLLPSGAFFSSYSLLIFMINLSIFYAFNSKSNIFSK